MSTIVYLEAYFDDELALHKKCEYGSGWGFRPEKESGYKPLL